MVSKTRCESICLGNGNSRNEFDLDELKKYGTVIGSNAIYRDFTPDILVALDSRNFFVKLWISSVRFFSDEG